MDALKKFLQKKKTDKAFKGAGPGQKLTTEGAAKAQQGGSTSAKSRQQSTSTSSSSGHGQHHQHQKSSGGGVPSSEEKRAAAAAALARLEKTRKPGEVDPDKLLASRQMAFIKEQARRELDAEKEKAMETTKDDHSASGGGNDQEETVRPTRTRATNPESMAVSGVYFCCPLIGPEILTKSEIEDNIKNFLLDQPEEEIGVTSCLMIHSCNKPYEKITNCVETLCKYLDNIISNPNEPKFQRIRCSNKVFQEKVGCVLGAEQFLRSAGFHKTVMKVDSTSDIEEEFWVFHPQDESSFTALLTELRDMLRQTTPIKPELDRNLQVLMPLQVKSKRDLPDEFYTLTLEEVKREQQLKSEAVENQQILRTKAMRERDELREQRLYRYGIMRIRFPDGFTLQGTFKAHEKLSSLYDFVHENLMQDIKFELVRSGGEALTDLDASLADLKLPPSSILNFKVDSAPAPLATGEVSFLKPEILALVTPLE